MPTFTPTFTLIDDTQTINSDGAAHLNDLVNYANTIVGLNGTAPVASVVLASSVVTVVLKDGRTFTCICHVDSSFNIACTGFYNSSEWSLLQAVTQVLQYLMANNAVANLTNTFA